MNKIMLVVTLVVLMAFQAWAKDVYFCPMHPTYTSDRPGSCPICGMNLVKKDNATKDGHKSKSDVAGYAEIHLDPAQGKLMGLQTTPVMRKTMTKTVRAVGTVAHDFEIYEAQQEYIEAWRQWKKNYSYKRRVTDDYRVAQKRVLKAEFALRHMGLPSSDLQKLREIKYTQPWVQPDLLFFSADHPFWVYAEIFESDLGFVDVGQVAQLEISAYGETVEGIVQAVAEAVDPMTHTVRVRIEVSRKSKVELKEGMLVNVVMTVELNNTLLVPRDAVMMTGKRSIAFVEKSKGVYGPVEVKTGWDADGQIQIKEGLKEGQMVVSGANFLVDSESRMQAALAPLLAGSASISATENAHE